MYISRIIAITVMLLVMASLFQGCNTLQGVGEDIEEAGEAVQDAAD